MSDLGATIFLLVCCYPVLPIMAAVMANEAKVKKNIAIGCTLPLTAQHDPRVQEICREYKKRVWRWFFIMTAALIPALLLLAQVAAGLFGFTLELEGLQAKLLELVNALFALLTILGVVADPTTAGVGDSRLALSYEEPKKN